MLSGKINFPADKHPPPFAGIEGKSEYLIVSRYPTNKMKHFNEFENPRQNEKIDEVEYSPSERFGDIVSLSNSIKFRKTGMIRVLTFLQ